MRNHILHLSLGLVLAACSADVLVDPSEESQTEPVPEEPVEPVEPSSPAVFCPSTPFSGDAEDAVIVLAGPEGVELVLRDGSTRSLDLGQVAEPNDELTVTNSVALGGEQIAVTHVENQWLNDELTQSFRVLWFTRAGELLAEESSAQSSLALGISDENVTLLVRADPELGSSALVLRAADGSTREVHDFDVHSSVIEGRYVAGYDPVALSFGFLDLATGDRRLIAAGSEATLLSSGGFAYLLPGDDAPLLVHERPSGPVETPLNTVLPESVWVERVENGSALLVAYGESLPLAWHVDLASGVVTEVPSSGPNGEPVLEHACGVPSFALLSDGSVLRAFRSGGDAFVAAFDPSLQSLTRLEPTFGAPFEFSLSAAAGTTMISVSDQQKTFCPINDWADAPSPGSVQGRSLALVRGEIAHVIEGVSYWDWQLSLSADGTCALAYDSLGTTRVIDVISGNETELGSKVGAFFN
jgi:hypothetical protein